MIALFALRCCCVAALLGLLAGCSEESLPKTPDAGPAVDVPDASDNDPDAITLLPIGDADPPQEAGELPATDAGADAAEPFVFAGRSSGCGTPQEGSGALHAFGTEAAGINRVYYFLSPANYEADRAYPLIVRFHGRGSFGAGPGLEIEQASAGAALLLSPSGLLDSDNETLDWLPANEARDLALYDKLVRWAASNYCVDLDRVFLYGHDSGGGLAQLIACRRGDQVRAVAASAARYRPSEPCAGQVAGYLLHDRNDAVVPLSVGVMGRERLRVQNGCSSEVDPIGGGCVRFRNCAAGEPLVWCESALEMEQAHAPPGVAGSVPIWRFFAELPALSSAAP